MSQVLSKAKIKQSNTGPLAIEIVLDRAELARLIALAERPVSIHIALPAITINGYPVTWGAETR